MEAKILKSAFILIGSLFLSKIVPKLVRLPKKQQSKKTETISAFIKQALTITIYFLAVLAILSMFGVDVTPYLLSSSIIGFAIGFGAQSLIKDIISGVYLLMEPSFKIGKHIQINSYEGELKKITLKNTYIESKNHELYIIPNGEIKTIVIKN